MSHRSHGSTPECAPDRKSVLFCPSCAHESPVGGDWRRRSHRNGVVYRCPSCGVAVTDRPADRASQTREPAGRSVIARSVRLAAGSVQLTLAWAVWPCSPGRDDRSGAH